MRHLIMLAAATAMTLSGVSVSQAQPRPGTNADCPRGQQSCPRPEETRAPERRGKEADRRPAPQATPPRPDNRSAQRQQATPPRQDSRPMPQAGASGRNGKPFQRAPGSRFAAPPRGQEYRVVNDHLVLVDSRSQNIVTVLGLLNSLTR